MAEGMVRPVVLFILFISALLCGATNLVAAETRDTRTEHVRFKEGRTGASISGTIVGYESVSYVVGAEAGQTMTVVLKPSNPATYFNVYQPGKGPGDEALAASDLTGPMTPDINKFEGKLPKSGEYTISVYMMRSAARRKERSNYTLSISISPLGDANKLPPVRGDFADGLQGGPDYWRVHAGAGDRVLLRASPTSPSTAHDKTLSEGTVLRNQGCRMMHGHRWCRVETVATPQVTGWVEGRFLRESSDAGKVPPIKDAIVPGTKFHAVGEVPCARYAGQPMTQCKFGVVRAGQGDGSVTIIWPDGGNRVIHFKDAAPAGFDRSETDGDARMQVDLDVDLFKITIGRQRFEIPQAVITGG